METDEFARFRDAKRLIIERQYQRLLETGIADDNVIDFLNPVKVDQEYWGITVGTWGGYLVQVVPMIYNDRIVLTPEDCDDVYDHGWCYDKGSAAMLAVMAWNPQLQAEPAGYKKRATPGVRQAGETAGGLSAGTVRAFGLMLALDMVNAGEA